MPLRGLGNDLTTGVGPGELAGTATIFNPADCISSAVRAAGGCTKSSEYKNPLTSGE